MKFTVTPLGSPSGDGAATARRIAAYLMGKTPHRTGRWGVGLFDTGRAALVEVHCIDAPGIAEGLLAATLWRGIWFSTGFSAVPCRFMP